MSWREFLESLESTGGKTFLLVVMLLWFALLAAILHVMGRDPKQTGLALESSMISSLFTALLMYLKPK